MGDAAIASANNATSFVYLSVKLGDIVVVGKLTLLRCSDFSQSRVSLVFKKCKHKRKSHIGSISHSHIELGRAQARARMGMNFWLVMWDRLFLN
jgi:hypothetical protein